MKRRFSAVSALLLLIIAAGCVETPSCGFGVDFSPDGTQIAFQDLSRKDGIIAVMNTDGSGYRAIAPTKALTYPIWSPDGRYILFYDGQSLCVYDTNRRQLRRLRDTEPVGYIWSADGRQIVYLTSKPAQAIWLDAHSGEVLLRVDLPVDPVPLALGANLASIPQTWNIAFIGSEGNLYTVEAGVVYQITHTGDVGSLWVSPDGTRLRWTRMSAQTKPYLVVHEYDLSSRTVTDTVYRFDLRRIPHPAGYELLPANGVFSPDGRTLLIQAIFARGNGKLQQSYSALYLAKIGQDTARLLLASEVNRGQTPVLITPRWSRDSSQVAAQILSKKRISLWVGRADGTAGRVIWQRKAQ
ncbi:MAG: TolB family protein [Armatimonadota bacterium]